MIFFHLFDELDDQGHLKALFDDLILGIFFHHFQVKTLKLHMLNQNLLILLKSMKCQFLI